LITECTVLQDFGSTEKAQAKIGSLDHVTHTPGGGTVKIESKKLEFKEKAQPRIGSLDKVKHQPGGGNVQVILNYSDIIYFNKSRVCNAVTRQFDGLCPAMKK